MNKLDTTTVGIIRYFEDVPIISKVVALSCLFFKYVEPYLFSLLTYAPLNLTFYRRSRIYLYLDSKPYEELFARFWKGDAYVRKHRCFFDNQAIKNNLECLNFTFFQHYANDPKMILSLANDSIETRKKLEKVKVFDLHVQADGSNLDQLQEKIAEKSVDLFKDLSIEKAVEKAEQLLALYDKPSDKVIQDITSFDKTNFKKKDFFISLFKNLDLELVKRIVNANRSLISYSPLIIRDDPEYVYKECFSELKDLNIIEIAKEAVNKDFHTLPRHFHFPANLKIFSKNEENLKNQEFLTKLFISAQKDRKDGCYWLLFCILITFNKQGNEFFKPFFVSLAKIKDDPELKDFFDTKKSHPNNFASSLMTYLAPGKIIKDHFPKIRFDPKLFTLLDQHWKTSSDFILQCLNSYHFLIEKLRGFRNPYNLIDKCNKKFFYYVDPEVLKLNYFIIFGNFIKSIYNPKNYTNRDSSIFFDTVESLFKSIHPAALKKPIFIDFFITLLLNYKESMWNEFEDDSILQNLGYIFGDGRKISGTPLKHDFAMMHSLCKKYPLLLKLHPDVWIEIIEKNPKWLEKFPWLIENYMYATQKSVPKGYHDRVIKINPAVLPLMLCDLRWRWLRPYVSNEKGEMALQTLVRLTINPRTQRQLSSFAIELCELFTERKLNNTVDYPSFIDKFVKILPELKFYIPKIIIKEYTNAGGAVVEGKLNEFWKGAISAGWHHGFPVVIRKELVKLCTSRKLPQILFRKIASQMMWERINSQYKKIENWKL